MYKKNNQITLKLKRRSQVDRVFSEESRVLTQWGNSSSWGEKEKTNHTKSENLQQGTNDRTNPIAGPRQTRSTAKALRRSNRPVAPEWGTNLKGLPDIKRALPVP